MHEIIENRAKRNDPIINNIFVQEAPKYVDNKESDNKVRQSTIVSVKNGYGFIFARPDNLFFHYSDVVEGDFNELADGDSVEYTIGRNRDGGEVARNVKKVRTQQMDNSGTNEYARTTYYEMKEKAKANPLGNGGSYASE
jgi:cold shock CspA family protein